MATRLFILFMLWCFDLSAQPVATGYPGSISILYDSSYSVAEESFNHRTIRLTLINNASNKVVAEYFRWSDSAFVYKGYDSAGIVFTSGLLALNRQKTRDFTIEIPDIVKDPDLNKGLFKDTVLQDFYYDKHGQWYEDMKTYTQWEGIYDHGLKDGEWKRTMWIPYHFIRGSIDSMEFYDKGTMQQYDYSLLTQDSIFEQLKGQWFAINPIGNGRIYHVYSRTKDYSEENMDFISADRLSTTYEDGRKQKQKWTYNNKKLKLSTGSTVYSYRIVLLNQDQLIIRRVQDE